MHKKLQKTNAMKQTKSPMHKVCANSITNFLISNFLRIIVFNCLPIDKHYILPHSLWPHQLYQTTR